MTITFIDSGVLVTAARGVEENSDKALAILGSNGREFASSKFIKLEVLPKAIYYQQNHEVEFYEEFFQGVTHWTNDLSIVITTGYDLAYKYGLAAMDALHIAAALSIGATEFITTEKPTKPMYRVTEIQVISIFG